MKTIDNNLSDEKNNGQAIILNRMKTIDKIIAWSPQGRENEWIEQHFDRKRSSWIHCEQKRLHISQSSPPSVQWWIWKYGKSQGWETDESISMKLDKTKYISSQGQGTWLRFWSCKSRNCTKFIWIIFLSQPCLVSAGLGFGPEVEYLREESLESPESLESLVGKEKTAKTFLDGYFVTRALAIAIAIAQWLWWGGSRWRRGSCSY